MARRLATYSSILKDSLRLFIKNDPLKLSGATAFFTLFALPPVLMILVQFLSLFVDPYTVKHGIFVNLSDIIGEEAMRQVVSIIREVRKLNNGWLTAVLLFTFLIFVATTLFKVIQSSINEIWQSEPQPGRKIITTLKSRAKSLGFIIITSLLFLIGIFMESLQVLIGNYFIKMLPAVSGFINQLLGFIISIFFIAIWFTIILKYLNDARPGWRVAWTGGFFTSMLFAIGKFVLHLLLNYNNVNNIYGASTSIVLLLLFVFYSAMILYFGAAFTKVWKDHQQTPKA